MREIPYDQFDLSSYKVRTEGGTYYVQLINPTTWLIQFYVDGWSDRIDNSGVQLAFEFRRKSDALILKE